MHFSQRKVCFLKQNLSLLDRGLRFVHTGRHTPEPLSGGEDIPVNKENIL